MSLEALSPFELEIARLVVATLHLEDTKPEDIAPQEPLFNEGLGLDSIDALELALAISKNYGFQMRSDEQQNQRVFASLRALSAHIAEQRVH
jgi:acyl carrier protein